MKGLNEYDQWTISYLSHSGIHSTLLMRVADSLRRANETPA